jgi:hypothetical protein
LNRFILAAAKEESSSSPNYVYILFEISALVLRNIKVNSQLVTAFENEITESLLHILQTSNSDLSSYAFQILSLFVACSGEDAANIKPNYVVLANSLVSLSNWAKDMKYLIPGMAGYLIAMLFKYPELMQTHVGSLQKIILQMMAPDFRMEAIGLQMGSALFEKLGVYDAEFLKTFLFAIFSTLHFYRNNTKHKQIPIPIIKAVHVFLSTFIVTNGTTALVTACDKIQKGILYMILKSEGENVKQVHGGGQYRDKKYALVGYSKFLMESIGDIP